MTTDTNTNTTPLPFYLFTDRQACGRAVVAMQATGAPVRMQVTPAGYAIFTG